MRPVLIAALLAMCLLLRPAQAETPPAAAPEPAAAEAPADGPSLVHSALKAMTYKAGTTAVNVTVYSLATGSLAAGTAFTAFGNAATLAIYAVNDYLWDRHAPPPVPQSVGQGFDLKEEFWRTTEKFLTWNATILWVKGIKATALLAYTGSSRTTAVAVGASTVLVAGIFYANNFAWDYYDWLTATPAAAAPPPEPAPLPSAQAPGLPRAAAIAGHVPKS